ncbi:MAG: DNA repair protein RecO [Actinobacteria bacterium]|nr:DNA repair protein RecO [Actinomycetota bacterium]
MATYRDRGIVLRSFDLGEADRIITFMTEGRGKVRAVAKGVRRTKSRFGGRLEGVRRTKSRFGGRLEVTNHVELTLYEGRSLDTITQADLLEHFRPVRENLDRLARVMPLLEVVDAVTFEGRSDPRLYHMLLGAIRALAEADAPLIVPAFFWKLLAHEGMRPEVACCASCGREDDLVAFELTEGGVLCRRCRRGTRLSPEALALLRRILGGQLVSVLGEGPSTAGHEVEHLATTALEHLLERRLRAAGALGGTQ